MTININKHLDYWRKNASDKWETAKGLFKIKRYADSLFYCHLTIECLLKGLIVKNTRQQTPWIHNLPQLASKLSLEFTDEQVKQFKLLNTFNIAGRYPDEKFEFYKRANRNYATAWLKNTNRLRLWLLNAYKKS